MVNPNINSFAQTPIDGQLDLSAVGGNVVSARVSNNIGAGVTLISGQAVKLDTATPGTAQDGVPPVLPLAAATDTVYGFVKYSIKDATFGANQRVEIALTNTLMYKTVQTASPAITRGSAVEYDYLTNTVLAWAGINPIVGFAYDAGISAGDLIRVWIDPPAFKNQSAVKNISVTATLAQINAGLVLIPGATGKRITVTNYSALVTGNFATGTAVILESNNVTPVVVSTIAEAGLTTAAVLTPNESHTTLGVGYGQPLGSGDGLQIVNSGAAQTGGTNIKLNISYTQA